ncbi:hypothetical protein GGI42DRAFT_362623 [Trichoderma sp. SZMC 28013]
MKKRDLIGSHRIDLKWTPSVASNRSTIIQDISVLISCCDVLTESGAGNYELCRQAQLIFSKALDQILNNEMPLTRSLPVSPTANMYGAPSAELPEAQSLDSITQDLQWAAWLDTIDF